MNLMYVFFRRTNHATSTRSSSSHPLNFIIQYRSLCPLMAHTALCDPEDLFNVFPFHFRDLIRAKIEVKVRVRATAVGHRVPVETTRRAVEAALALSPMQATALVGVAARANEPYVLRESRRKGRPQPTQWRRRKMMTTSPSRTKPLANVCVRVMEMEWVRRQQRVHTPIPIRVAWSANCSKGRVRWYATGDDGAIMDFSIATDAAYATKNWGSMSSKLTSISSNIFPIPNLSAPIFNWRRCCFFNTRVGKFVERTWNHVCVIIKYKV